MYEYSRFKFSLKLSEYRDNMKKYDVIIVGGGPTGVALGIELALNKIDTLILEKYPAPMLSPRAQFINARSMEFFMRWELDINLKDRQICSDEFPNRMVWCSKLNGETYALCSSNDQLNAELSPQLGIRIPLWITEEKLRNKLNDFSCIQFLKLYEAVDIKLDKDDEVTVTAKTHNQEVDFKTSYVVACDGTNSIIRKKIGIDFKTLAPSRRVIGVVFETFHLEKYITISKGSIFILLENKLPGAIGAINPQCGLWYAQIFYGNDTKTIDEIDIDHLLNEVTGIVFSKKILNAHFWDMHIQLAEQFSYQNRIFLVGDSAHGFVPTGALGLNTGFGDVVNLAWKLAAVIKGRMKKSLLTTYEQERRPICLRNLKISQKNADKMAQLRKKYPPEQNQKQFAIENAKLAKKLSNLLGASMGYAYFNSPLTQLEKDQSIKPMSKSTYHPTVAPGYFLAHIWIKKQKSIYHCLSATAWTLIISGESNSLSKWQKIMNKYPFKIEILKIHEKAYSKKYVFIRPDWHIAFTSDQLNDSYFSLIENLLG